MVIDAREVHYKELNEMIKGAVSSGEQEIVLKNVNGQRYIGSGLNGKCRIIIEGIPGEDTAAFMNGPELDIRGNAQNTIANTMNDGRVIIHGNCGDISGYAMRGGEVYIKGNAGYRVGIHMKQFRDKMPRIIIGGKTGDYLGEYMTGGIIIVLGLNLDEGEDIIGDFCGTGMRGGIIYIRGDVRPYKLGREVKLMEADETDMEIVNSCIKNFESYFGYECGLAFDKRYIKLISVNERSYSHIYAY